MVVKGITVNPKDINRIKKWMDRMPKTVLRELEKSMKHEAQETIKQAQSNMSVFKYPTGLLKRSKFLEVKRTAKNVSVAFGFRVTEAREGRTEVYDYSDVVEKGRKTYRPFKGYRYMAKAMTKRKKLRSANIAKGVRKGLKGR